MYVDGRWVEARSGERFDVDEAAFPFDLETEPAGQRAS